MIILVARNNELATLTPYAPRVLDTLQHVQGNCLIRIQPDGRVDVIQKP